MPITLPTGQVINDNDPNYATYAAQQKATTGSTGSAVVNAATTATTTPNMTLSEAQAKADAQLSGLATPMSLSEIRSREAEQKAATLAGAEAQFNPQIRAEQATGRRVLSSAEGATGQRQGFNLSTAESAYLAGIEQEVNQRVKDVENQKAAAISTGNLAAIQRAEDNIAKLTEAQNNIALKKIELGLNYFTAKLQERTAVASEKTAAANQELQEQELNLNAIKTAQDTPVGNTFIVNGITYKGMKDSSGLEPAMINISVDDKGFETATNKLTGEVLWKSTTPTGKSKTAASSVTVNMPSYGSSVNKVVGADGKIVGYVRFDSKSNQVIKQDVNGNTITEFPAGSVIGEPNKDDGGWGI